MEGQDNCKSYFNHEHVHEFEVQFQIKVFLTILYSIILVAGIIGNTVTIKVAQVLQKKCYLHKSVADHIISLSCADLLVLLLGMPVELYSVLWFPFSTSSGNAACKVYNFLFETCSYATILHVATLSFERYIAICHPLKHKSVSGSRTVKLICFVWLTSFIIALPLLFAMGQEDPTELSADRDHNPYRINCDNRKSNRTICTNLSSKRVVFQSSVFSAFALYIVTLVSVACMCKMMMNTLLNMEFESKEDFSKQRNTKVSRKQSIVFLVLIVVTLVVCWTPLQIRRIMAASKARSHWTIAYLKAFLILMPISDTFFYLSSVLNPLLYCLSSRQFRAVFMQVLRCKISIVHRNMQTINRNYTIPKINTPQSTKSLLPAPRKDVHSHWKSPRSLPSPMVRDKVFELEPLSHQNCDPKTESKSTGFNLVSRPEVWDINSEPQSPEQTTVVHLKEQPNEISETEI
ncbi:G-protein coupled receptor 39-like isoform X2 [Hypanus sabinus]|uniref:G-protein coupled receptor 39-like isoform X2 n=1 Tax=Hypanus sabinus TaxID=79690 RepID=UPI0028C39331|nr:G-protein coupled receptor 39-like isoform X2 [Hypanus sabinus]